MSGPLPGTAFDVPLGSFRGPLGTEDLTAVLAAIPGTPSAANLQPWRFWVLADTDRPYVAARAQDALGRPRPNHRSSALTEVPTLLLAGMDVARAKCRFGDRGADLFGIQDVAVATHAVRAAAWQRGVGSHWVREIDLEGLQQDLALPPGVRAQALLALGRCEPSAFERPPALDWRQVTTVRGEPT